MEETKSKSENPVVKNILQTFSDAGTSLIKLAKDPIGGQSKAIEELGPKKAFNVSIIFMIFYVVAIYLFAYNGVENTFKTYVIPEDSLIPTPKAKYDLTLEHFFKLFLFSFVPFITLFLAVFGSSFLSKTKHDVSTSLFVTGLISIPLGFFFYVLNFVSNNSLPIAFVISIFTVSFAVLLLNASFMEIYKLSSRLTMVLIPSVFTVSGFFSYLLFNYFLLR